MRKFVVLAGVALLALPMSIPAQGQDQGNQGQGGGQGRSAKTGGNSDSPGKPGNSGANKQAERPGPGKSEHSDQFSGQDRGKSQRQSGSAANGQAQRGAKAEVTVRSSAQSDRGNEFSFRFIENGRYAWRDPGFQGCPPGLAKKGNGCLPPGQARKLSNLDNRDLRWFRYSDWYRANRSDDWRYDRGYAYRVDSRSNLIQSVLPLLGGALFGGNRWPQSSLNYRVTPYQDRYYRFNDSYEYRYANGAVFAVDPETQMIQSVAGLLTGDNWAVGSAVPLGYDLYNVPYDYRNRYADSGSSLYRYDDGYIYEIDPTTQLVRGLIELVI